MAELKPCPYKEIIALYEYCNKIGINAVMEDMRRVCGASSEAS